MKLLKKISCWFSGHIPTSDKAEGKGPSQEMYCKRCGKKYKN